MTKRLMYFLYGLTILAILLFFGCGLSKDFRTITRAITIEEKGDYPDPLIKPLPLNIGVYYALDFRTSNIIREKPQHGGPTLVYNIELGKANSALFDYILSHVFENVTPFFELSDALKKQSNLDVIIEPKLDEYDFGFTASTVYVDIKYKVAFHFLNSEKVTWVIEVNVNGPSNIFGLQVNPIKELTRSGMREVAARFMAGFCNQREIKELFSSQCNQ